jgi:UDP-N-acetylmuramate: L-alanyl-gamma-D-glutamyl-meso-diaminopimelate ligase
MDYALFESKKDESFARIKAVSALSPGAHIHLSAICGTGMGSVASLLKQRGFYITGTDKRFYPPMGDVVRSLADKLYEGYQEENLSPRPELVVIGNNLSKDNPEVQAVLKNNIPFASMPEVFGALLIGDHHYCGTSIVVTGTHGKTTTTAAVATILETAHRKPGYFVGGVPNNLPGGVRPPDFARAMEERVVVLEGDEYDSAFFAKWPKFLSYRPDILIITSIEFDHADIYENLVEIEREFSRLVSMMPKNGLVLVADHGKSLERLVAGWKKNAPCKVLTYGESGDLKLVFRKPSPEGQKLELKLSKFSVTADAKMGGIQNALNLLAAAGACEFFGLSADEISKGIETYTGVLRRQTVHGLITSGATMIEDFAHHPTAVKLTLDGIKEQYPNKRIVAAYEPRSNTSMRSIFQEDYTAAFGAADLVLLLTVGDGKIYNNTKSEVGKLNVEKLTEDLKSQGKEALVFSSASELGDWILAETGEKDLVVCMSNGDFGGLIQRLSLI